MSVGDPPLGRWRHHGLIQHFCTGQWTESPPPLTALGVYRQRLRELYDARTDADYSARPLSASEARAGLALAEEILAMIAQKKGLLFL
jgi:hypothetical protein